MKIRTTIGLLGVLLFALLPALAAAHEEDAPNETARPGWYAGIAGVWALHLFEDDAEEAFGNFVSVSDSPGIAVKAGYRINKWFAAEFMYEWIEGFRVDGPLNVKLFDIVGHGFTVNGKVHYPIQNWHPYFLGGMGFFYTDIRDRSGTGLFASSSENAFAGRVGVGFDLYINPKWVINLQTTAVLTTTDISAPTKEGLSALHYLSNQFGLMYRF